MTPPTHDPILSLRSISKNFGEGPVLNDLALDVFRGEFLTLLGPSGCGKTTALRIIAGLEQPSSGTVWVDGKEITDLPPEKRPVNTVFQNYALFPHMNVFQNIAYGLKIQKVSKQEQHRRVMEALELVRLSGYEKRMPPQLSGGQRQRVAIARAIVLKPQILLLDEPLGALDLKLRQEMQKELKQLQRQLGITFIYITHDQEEALNMSTRIAILNKGKIEQIGTPEEIYDSPNTLFVADFIGQSNKIRAAVAEVRPENDGCALLLKADGLLLPGYIKGRKISVSNDQHVVLCVRPQHVHYGNEPQCGMELKGSIQSTEYVGGMQHVQISVGKSLLLNSITQSTENRHYTLGSEVYVGWEGRQAPVVPDEEAKE